MKKISVKGKGEIEYRLPNLPEGMVMLGEMGYSFEDLQNFGENAGANNMIFMGKLLDKLDMFVEKINVKTSEGKITDFDQLLTMEYIADFLMPMATDVIESIMGVKEGKKPS